MTVPLVSVNELMEYRMMLYKLIFCHSHSNGCTLNFKFKKNKEKKKKPEPTNNDELQNQLLGLSS